MLDIYIYDIKKSLENDCYYSALALALTLPDICGMIEFPNETSTAKRYIGWYDKYLGPFMAQEKDKPGEENPWLSGEIIYNLRNTYLHTGSPNVKGDKVKEEANRIDRFTLVLGEGTGVFESTVAIDFGHGKEKYRAICVDVTYLCNSICSCALGFYKNNREKFQFDFNVITKEDFEKQSVDNTLAGDVVKEILDSIKIGLDKIFSDEEAKERPLNGESSFVFNRSLEEKKKSQVLVHEPKYGERNKPEVKGNRNAEKKVQQNVCTKQNISKRRRDAQVRSFFGKNFKESIYVEKKEEIIQAILKAKTKQQVNNSLMKSFSSKETGVIYKRLKPIIKDLPGK